MERRVTRKFETHMVDFKNALKEWLTSQNCTIVVGEDSKDVTSEFLKMLYDFKGMELTKEDFMKRRRVKNVVPHCDRCLAKRANGEQCTRRKNSTQPFCGTHAKGTPHGVVTAIGEPIASNNKIEVWVEEIQGICYYIDSNHNVYKHDDVLNNNPNPDIIAKWEMSSDGQYHIPEYHI
tara:strand:+ start:1074 stop:1607 length:534 start_codon:yes stop_codon:yes gene_type:complete